jgi:hypothetical protein
MSAKQPLQLAKMGSKRAFSFIFAPLFYEIEEFVQRSPNILIKASRTFFSHFCTVADSFCINARSMTDTRYQIPDTGYRVLTVGDRN